MDFRYEADCNTNRYSPPAGETQGLHCFVVTAHVAPVQLPLVFDVIEWWQHTNGTSPGFIIAHKFAHDLLIML